MTREQLAPAFAELVAVMKNGATPKQVAEFVLGHRFSVALSHTIEDQAYEGTFAEKVFNILCGECDE
jgi:hypothetical protein